MHCVSLDLSPEISALPELGDAAKAALLARERREVFSIHPEVRALSWGGSLLLAAAAAALIRNNADVLGPTFVAVLIGLAAAACYAWAWRRRGTSSVLDDYVLLLGALLVSADVGFIEQQFDVLGQQGQRHFLLLAIVHGFVAYLFDSRLVLTLSVSALAAWIGVERRESFFFGYGDAVQMAVRLFTCALAVLTWREVDRRFRAKRTFERAFEHFAANFALLGGLMLTLEKISRLAGVAVTLILAGLAIAWGFRTRAESFVLYGFLYAVIALDIWIVDAFDDNVAIFFTLLVSAIVAIVGLLRIHAWFQRRES
jgi:hypothetical protein